jgi:ferrous iron transport protein A
MHRRFLDIGLTPDTLVECVNVSPQGDPKAFLIRGAVIAIRREDCKNILIKEVLP